VYNEATELEKLLISLIPYIGRNDEIIVLQDITNKDTTVSKLLQQYKKKLIVIEKPLNNDFAAFKNVFLTVANGNYLFQIDADEIPNAFLIKNLKKIILTIGDCDCFMIPRINIVNESTSEHIKNRTGTLMIKTTLIFRTINQEL
jgi:glycosyltransferase involved in cell wall biosynthesis